MDKRDKQKEIFYLCRNNKRSLGMFSQEEKRAEEDRIEEGREKQQPESGKGSVDLIK